MLDKHGKSHILQAANSANSQPTVGTKNPLFKAVANKPLKLGKLGQHQQVIGAEKLSYGNDWVVVAHLRTSFVAPLPFLLPAALLPPAAAAEWLPGPAIHLPQSLTGTLPGLVQTPLLPV